MFEDTNTTYALDSKIIIPNSLDFIIDKIKEKSLNYSPRSITSYDIIVIKT